MPYAPQNFTANAGNGQVALSWSTPANDGGRAIARYEVSADNGAIWTSASSATAHTFTGLTNGTSYTFKVRAVNVVGAGAEATLTATPFEDIPTVNDVPVNDTLKVWIHNGTLYISGLVGHTKPLFIYHISGTLVYSDLPTGDKLEIHLLERGVYVIVVGGKTIKVVL